MKRKLFLLAAAMLWCANVAMAIPAFKAKKQVTCVDGSTLELTLVGDEHLHFWTDQNGRALRLLQDGSVRVLSPFELENMKATAAEARAKANTRRQTRTVTRAIGDSHPLFGKKKGLVILMQTPDMQFSRENPNALYRDIFNKEGYSDNGFVGSVADYFRAQSYGQFEIEFDVVGPYTAKMNMAYYGRNDQNGNDTNVRELIEEGMRAADADVNFWDYDWDDDGEVDQVFVLYAGYGEHVGAGTDYIWPHESALYLNTPLMMDGVKLDTYACSCEFLSNVGTELDGIGTACHEFSHCLGYPDFYDVTYGGNPGMGSWDIMDSGSYLNKSRTPAGYSAYERSLAGWLTLKEIKEETHVTGMKPLAESPEAYVLYNEKNRNEYYVLENRQLVGTDAGLPGHGLMVVHVDYNAGSWGGNSVNVGATQHMTIIPAYRNTAGYGRSSDLFPGTMDVRELTDVSTPAATLNNRNTDGEKLMHKPIEDIREENGLISMIVCAPLLTAPEFNATEWSADGTQADVSWQPVERAKTYELMLTGHPRKGNVEDAVVMDEDFAGCYKASVGFSDIASSMDKYTTNKGFSGSKLYQSPNLLRIGTSTTTGFLRTPAFEALNTGDLTIVMEVQPLKEGTQVSGNVAVVTNRAETRHSIPFSFSTATKLVLHSTVKFTELFQLLIQPESGMYISRLTLYDGNFSEAELGTRKAPGRAADKTVTTSDTHYLFTGLDPAYEYTVQIRAKEDARSSVWSGTYTIAWESAIEDVTADKRTNAHTGTFDLQGRKVDTPTRKGIYIIDGKKRIVK